MDKTVQSSEKGYRSNSRKCIVIALMVLCITVLWGNSGFLTLPGILVASTGIILILKNKYEVAGIMFIIAFIGSIMGQQALYFCLNCAMAAVIFLIAAVAVLFDNYRHAVIAMITAVIIPLAAIYVCHITIKEVIVDRDLLYTSPYCTPCIDVVERFIDYDPMGNTWSPVIVTEGDREDGEKQLREAGYKGNVLSGEPPIGVVPCLMQADTGKVLVGKSIVSYVKTLQ